MAAGGLSTCGAAPANSPHAVGSALLAAVFTRRPPEGAPEGLGQRRLVLVADQASDLPRGEQLHRRSQFTQAMADFGAWVGKAVMPWPTQALLSVRR